MNAISATERGDPAAIPQVPHPTRRPLAPRVTRQLRRLDSARAHQLAQPNTLTEIDGTPLITAEVASSTADNWPSLRRVVRRARRNGYASESVEDTFLYIATYDPDGIDVERNPDLLAPVPTDLLQSGILFEDDHDRNALVISTVPSPEGRGPQRFLPYFLYSLPQTSVIDLLHGRMVIFNLVNPGRLTAAIEQEAMVERGQRSSSPLIA